MELSYGKLRDPAACSTLVGVSTERKSQCLKAELGPLPGSRVYHWEVQAQEGKEIMGSNEQGASRCWGAQGCARHSVSRGKKTFTPNQRHLTESDPGKRMQEASQQEG